MARPTFILALLATVATLASCGAGSGNEASASPDTVVAFTTTTTTTRPAGDERTTTTTTTSTTSTTSTTTTAVPAQDEPEPEDPLETWQEATRSVCGHFEPSVAALVADLDPPETLGDLTAQLDALEPLNDQYLDALMGVPRPDGHPPVERVYELYLEHPRIAEALRDAAGRNDEDGVRAASERSATHTAQLEQILTELGLPECVSG